MNPYEDNLRRLIREHIKSERVSLSKVAELVGVSYPTLNGFMTGNANARDATVEKIETYFARVQPNGEQMDRTTVVTSNGHQSTYVPRKSGPPALPGFTLAKRTVMGRQAMRINVEIDESRATVKLLSGVRTRMKIESGDRVYLYLSDDLQRIAVVPAPKQDDGVSLNVSQSGELYCSYLRDDLVKGGWSTCSHAPKPLPGVDGGFVIERAA